MDKQKLTKSVNVNEETFNLLKQLSEHLAGQFGFNPTFGQVIKSALTKAYPELNNATTRPISNNRQQSLLN